MEEIIYGTGALVRYLSSYSQDFNAKEGSYHQAKDFIQRNVAFRCCLQRHVSILHVFTQICYEKTAKVFQKLWLRVTDSTEVVTFNHFVTYIGVSCAES